MNLLITGGYGFIGFNYLLYILQFNHENINTIINVDNKTYAGKFLLKEKQKILKQYSEKYKHYNCNINNFAKLDKIITKHKITHIINFAAETHVDNSIKNPNIFVESNICGVQTLLELCKKYNIRFHQVSTDEVYGSVDPELDNVTEEFKLNPSSPYSASKTSADLLIQAYVKTFGINATISRCTNNYGPWQHTEKLIPKVIYNAINDIKIPVYGNGLQMRNWIFVQDHCAAINKIINSNDYAGEVFNIGSTTLIPNIEVIKQILQILQKPESLIQYVTDRPAHDFCYHLNSAKITEKFNWREQNSFWNGLTNTIDFYQSWR